MPTVLRITSFRVTIYSNDHAPAHVHVIGSDCEAVFALNCPLGPIELRESYRVRAQDLRAIARQLTWHLAHLCSQWKGIHGHF